MLEGLQHFSVALSSVNPPEGVEEYHRLQLAMIRSFGDVLVTQVPSDSVSVVALFGLGIVVALDEAKIARKMPPDLLSELNEHGCDLSTDDPLDFSFGDE